MSRRSDSEEIRGWFSWLLNIYVGLCFMAMLIVPILFFYPLYYVWINGEPVLIFGILFFEPFSPILVLEMLLCVMAFTGVFIILWRRRTG